MKRILLTLLAVSTMVLSGCATTKQVEIIKYENQLEVGPYLRMFQTEMLVRKVPVAYPMEFRVYIARNLNAKLNNVVGLCRYYSNTIRIYLDEEAWYSYDDIGRELLLFHELGHCVLGLEHNRARFRDGLPYSIMYPSLFDPYTYNKHRRQYLTYLAKEWHAQYGPRTNLNGILKKNMKRGKTHVLRPGKAFLRRYK